MNKPGNNRRLYILSLLLFLTTTVLFLYVLYEIVENPVTCLVLLLLYLPPPALFVFWFFRIRHQVSDFTDEICNTLDRMIAGLPPGEENFADTLTARIQDKLRQYNQIVRSSKDQSIHAREELQSIVSDISHQVKTPIANVKMYTGILQQRELETDQRRDFLLLMEKQVKKLEFLMDSMIKMSRLEVGLVSPSQELIPVYNTIADALDSVWPKAEAKQIQLTVHCDPALTAAHDRKWTAEALFNILDNAVKYTDSGGAVSIKASPWQFYIRIDITDTGKGITPERYNKIFKRFYREPEVAGLEGVGLGLYLAREIITLQRGYIKMSPAPEKGSCFSVFLLNENIREGNNEIW